MTRRHRLNALLCASNIPTPRGNACSRTSTRSEALSPVSTNRLVRPPIVAISNDADMRSESKFSRASRSRGLDLTLIHMRIGVPAEIRPGETRIAATPETVGKFVQKGHHTCVVQANAPVSPRASPMPLRGSRGHHRRRTRPTSIHSPTSCSKCERPEASEIPFLRRGTILVGLLNPADDAGIDALAETGVTAFALEALPRITRAQAWTCSRRRRTSPATRRS